ncbi:MAG: endo-1,4-beta-xylanase [Pirellulaceae bacterium]
MGQMRFVVPCKERIPNGAVECGYLSGIEGIPWRGRCHLRTDASESTELVIERSVSESGNFCIPWHVAGHGELALATASLMERAIPYNLPVELARGALNRWRNQAADWKMSGLVVPEALGEAIATASETFGQAVSADSEVQAAELAESVLKAVLDASEALADEYSRQTLATHRQQSGPLSALLGGTLSSQPLTEAETRLLPRAWNSAVVPFSWRDIEHSTGKHRWAQCDRHIQWCHSQSWRIVGGPLLQLDKRHLPDWIYLWEEDFEHLQTYFLQFIRAAVGRYQGKVHIWHCAARMNVEGALSLSEEQRIRLVVAAIDEIRRVDPQTPMLVSFDQPWAEYLASRAFDLSPLHFADSLIRADLGVAGVGLELNMGYWPGGTLMRDRIEISRQLDRWSLLGLPLVVFLSIPSSGEPAPDGQRKTRASATDTTTNLSPEHQQAAIQKLMPLLLAKSCVQGLFWNQLSDADPCEFAHGGLFDAESRPKPLLDTLISLRQQYLT